MDLYENNVVHNKIKIVSVMDLCEINITNHNWILLTSALRAMVKKH
jgi:hypothetical protein